MALDRLFSDDMLTLITIFCCNKESHGTEQIISVDRRHEAEQRERVTASETIDEMAAGCLHSYLHRRLLLVAASNRQNE
jgi:hypothetical protein